MVAMQRRQFLHQLALPENILCSKQHLRPVYLHRNLSMRMSLVCAQPWNKFSV